MATILVVEDEVLTRRTLQELLTTEGFSVVGVGSIAEAIGEIGRRPFDLILLDLVLPDGDGLACCKRIRARHQMPIIILSTRRELSDRVAGLETGADDYVVKPFDPPEIVARVRAQLRRAHELSRTGEAEVIRVGRLTVDSSLQDAVIEGRPAGLTQKEFRLLHFMAVRAGRAVSRDTLIDELWSEDELASEKHVAVYIRRIRQKIENNPDEPEILLTVRGFGYKVGA